MQAASFLEKQKLRFEANVYRIASIKEREKVWCQIQSELEKLRYDLGLLFPIECHSVRARDLYCLVDYVFQNRIVLDPDAPTVVEDFNSD